MRGFHRRWLGAAAGAVFACVAGLSPAQPPAIRTGEAVPRDVRDIYEGGCRFLARSQDASGSWKDANEGPGVTGMAMMVLLASGEDPNHGAYRTNIRRALRSIISAQDRDTGYYGSDGRSSMYHHGFAMLAMAEAYGAVDDRDLWAEEGAGGKGLSIGESLELAVRLAVTSARKNPIGAWRYSPDANDHDTSVSGAILMGLLAARNAGIDVPDETVDKALAYYASMTGADGSVGYASPGGGSDATTSIGLLVMAIARRKDLPQYGTVSGALVARSRGGADGADSFGGSHVNYTRYYRAQALFQADFDAWKDWNGKLVERVKSERRADGAIGAPGQNSGEGEIAGTALSLLALAVNFRFLPVYER